MYQIRCDLNGNSKKFWKIGSQWEVGAQSTLIKIEEGV